MLCHCSLAVGKCIYWRPKINPGESLFKQQISLLNSVSWAVFSGEWWEGLLGRCVRVNAPQLSAHTRILQRHSGRLGSENWGVGGALALFFLTPSVWHTSTSKSLCSVTSMREKSLSKRCAQESLRHDVCWKHSLGPRPHFILPVQW